MLVPSCPLVLSRNTREAVYRLAKIHLSVKRLSNRLYSTKSNLNKWLVMRKLTRYEYEQHTNQELSEDELKAFVIQKGSDYKGLIARDADYHKVLDKVTDHLKRRSRDVRVVTRSEYSEDDIQWADAILTVGGDGTFLLAASKINGIRKPMLGINSDPQTSEGYLCLSKKSSLDFTESLDQILHGDYSIMLRQRIRLTMSGHHNAEPPVNLLDQELQYPEYRWLEHVREHEDNTRINLSSPQPQHVLPVLALNDVFIGESLSARVSFYHLSKDGSVFFKQKSSGITVCTGTGSTSWFFNINHIPMHNMKQILQIASDRSATKFPVENEHLVEQITDEFNQSLKFSPSKRQMSYTVRDPVMNGIFKDGFQVIGPRGFCQEMKIRSRMWDGWVVVDGSLSFRFNDSAMLLLEIRDQDALPCITIT